MDTDPSPRIQRHELPLAGKSRSGCGIWLETKPHGSLSEFRQTSGSLRWALPSFLYEEMVILTLESTRGLA